MPVPKLMRIVDAVVARLANIAPENGYYSNIGRTILTNAQSVPAECLPCCHVVTGERVATETRNDRAACDMAITITAYHSGLASVNELLGYQLLADMQRAIEAGDMTLGGLVRDRDGAGLAFVSDEIFLPEIGASAIGARVTYSAPHVRRAGDPEIN